MVKSFVDHYTKQKKVFVTKMKENISIIFHDFFEDNSDIKKLTWTQYTPYFNDGEPCEFSTYLDYMTDELGYTNKQIEKIDAIGHSEGCMVVILAATLYPERFRDIVLVNPAGMIGKDNPWRLATSFAREVVKGYVDEVRKNGLSEPMLRAIRETTTAVINDPVQSFREVLALSNVQIHELLIGLREKGIGISIVSAVDDGVFPDKRMQEIVTKDMVDGYFTVRGHHAQFQLDAERYTQLADYALEMMQQKRERSQQPQGTVLENVEVIPEG